MSADTSASPASPATGLLHRTLRRRWRPLLGCAAAVALLGAAGATATAPTYTSSAEVVLRPLPGNAFAPDALDNSQQVTVGLTTEANLVGSAQVLALAAKAPGSPVRAGDDASGSVVVNSQILRVSYSASTRTAARAGADAVARAFLTFRRTAAERLRDTDVARLQAQIAEVTHALDQSTDALSQPNPAAGSAARAQVLTTRLAGLQESLGTAQAEPTEPGAVVAPATEPGHLQQLRPVLLVAFGGLTLLLVAVGVACWRTWVDEPVSSADRKVAGLPVWASVPSTRVLGSRRRDRRRQLAAEHYRQLRTALVAELPAPCVVTLGATDDAADLADIAADLGTCLRVGGFDTTLVDCDPRAGSLSLLLGMHDEPGLTDLLRGARVPEDNPTTGHGVQVIPLGSSPEHAADLLAGRAFDALVAAQVRRTSYLVLVAPRLDSAVGLRCAGLSDAVLVVADADRTRRRDVEDVVARVAGSPGLAAAVVVAHLPRRRRRRLRARRSAADAQLARQVEQLRQDEEVAEDGGHVGVEVGESA